MTTQEKCGFYPPPRRVDIYLTHQCNLVCPFCFYHAKGRNFFCGDTNADVSPEKWIGFLEELQSLKVLEVGLMGGEALMYDGFWKLISWLSKNRLRFALFSNGILLDDEAVKKIASSRRCSYVQISIDGTEKTHDNVRGQGVYRNAQNAIMRLTRSGIPVHVNMVFRKGTANDIAQEAHHLIVEMGINQLRINPETGDEAKTPDEMDIADAIGCLQPLRKQFPKILRGSGVFKYLRTIHHPFEPNTENDCPNCEKKLWTRCAILADGSAIPCMDAENVIIGNVFDSHFVDLWQSDEWLACRLAVHRPRPIPNEICHECHFAANCRQNCLSSAVQNHRHICYKRLLETLTKRGLME